MFFLKESARQSILTVFNWTNHSTTHTIRLTDLHLSPNDKYTVINIFNHHAVPLTDGTLHITLPMQDVSVLKIIDDNQPAAPPDFLIHCPQNGATGATLHLSADSDKSHPAISFLWNFGDGVEKEGTQVDHAWTIPGDYTVQVTAHGLSDLPAEKTCTIHISGSISTTFDPLQIKRFKGNNSFQEARQTHP